MTKIIQSRRGGGRDPLLAALIFFILLTPAFSTNQLVSLQGRVLQSGSPQAAGNIAVTIWNQQENGTVLYSENFPNSINDGFFDLMLGSSSELNLTYGQFYYLDMYVDGDDINWTSPAGSIVNRIQFQSQNGQISTGMIQVNAVNTTIIQNDAVTAAKIAPSAVNSSHLNSAGTYYMGRLGIGTIGPSADLEIKSSSSIGAINVTNGTGYPVFFVNASSQKVSIGTTNFSQVAADHIVQIAAENNVSGGGQLAVTGRTNVGMQLLIGYDTGGNYGKIQAVEQNVAARALALNPIGGNVGIGTTGPLSPLDISATLSNTVQFFTLSNSGAARLKMGIYTPVTDGTYISSNNVPLRIETVGSGASRAITFYTGDTTTTEKMRINGDGNVGINTTSPDTSLHIKANWVSNQGTLKLQSADTTSLTGITLHSSTSTVFKGALYYDNSINTMYLRNYGTGTGGKLIINSDGGYVGIGTDPSYQLQLSTDSAAKPSTNTWTISSDARVKKDIRPFTDGLSVIEKIDPVWYRYNGLGGFVADGKDHIGVVGQDIQKAAPYTVNAYKAKLNPNDANETELLNFNSHALTFVLINAVKELDARVAGLERENAELRQKIGS